MSPSIRSLIIAILGILCSNSTVSQVYNEAFEQSIVSTIESEDNPPQIEMPDLLYAISEKQVDLNGNNLNELIESQLLSPIQVHSLQTYIAANGPLISKYELQAVPHFSVEAIRNIFPYVTIKSNAQTSLLPFQKKNMQGSSELILRWGQILEKQPAYDPISGLTQFNGNKSRLYLRYRFLKPGKLYFGLTAEKDPGEELFHGSNPYGFDFYSFHLFIINENSWIPRIAIGDFSISMGHGLIINSGFTLGKSAMTTRLISAHPPIRPYTAANEHAFSRGIAFEIKPTRHISATLFYSNKQVDASVIIDSTFDIDGNRHIYKSFSSLQTSGNHRSNSEINNRNQVRKWGVGSSIQFKKKHLQIALNTVHHRFSKIYTPKTTTSSATRGNVKYFTNVSLSYSYGFNNLFLFGESAIDQFGVLATINGLLLVLDKKIDVAILGRYIPASYQHFEARTFGESSSAENESGIYLGTVVRLSTKWTINAYADIWKHKWPRFNVDGPGQGNEQLVRLTYHKRHHSTFYIQYRHETKDKNSSLIETHIEPVVLHTREYLRLHFSHRINPGIELRNRVEFSLYHEELQKNKKGILIYQDVIFKPIGFPLTFTSRIAFFDTNGYLSRIYAYENDLSYQFSVPAYTNRGVRYYLNLKYSGLRHVSIEARISQTRYYDQTVIGSGNLMIAGDTKTDLKLQLRMKF